MAKWHFSLVFPNLTLQITCRTINDADVPVGFSQRIAARLLPSGPFVTPAARRKLANDIVRTMRANVPTISLQNVLTLVKPVSFHIYMTLPRPAKYGGPSGTETGANTAWRDARWQVVAATGWTLGM